MHGSMSIKWIDSVWLKCCNSRPSGLNTSITLKFYRFILIILLPLALGSVVGFGLSKNVPPFCPICHHLSPPSHSQHLKISFFLLLLSILSWAFPLRFVPSSSWEIFLGILSSSILSMWPNQLILCPSTELCRSPIKKKACLCDI